MLRYHLSLNNIGYKYNNERKCDSRKITIQAEEAASGKALAYKEL